MADNEVMRPLDSVYRETVHSHQNPDRPPEIHCVTPLLGVVRESEVEDALEELGRLDPAHTMQREGLERWEGADHGGDPFLRDEAGFIDRLNAALEAHGSPRRVKTRLCSDFSRSLNAHLIKCPMTFHPVDELLEVLRPGHWLCKVDYRRCFHNIPLHPAMYPYMGHRMEDQWWVAVRVVFGISLGPFIASILTGETAKAMRAGGVPCSVYLDDNAIAGRTEAECYENRGTGMSLAIAAGWPISLDKLEEDKPDQQRAYRGIVFDTINRCLTLSPARLASTGKKVRALLEGDRFRFHQVRAVRSVLGSLEWTATCVPAGRLHTVPIYEDIHPGAQNNWRMSLSDDSVEHLEWWADLLERASLGHQPAVWAGFDKPITSSPTIRMYSDASGQTGFGALCGDTVLIGQWATDEARAQSTSWKEWVPVCLLMHHLAASIPEGTTLVVTTDNSGNQYAMNSGASCKQTLDMLAHILQTVASHHLRCVGDWIPREFNNLADALSRFSVMPGERAWDAATEAQFRAALAHRGGADGGTSS
jgi:hypothetical protein